jgi:dTDP-4-dehydrorhamnose reductase
MVGRALCTHCETLGDQVFGADHEFLDIAAADRVLEVIAERKPDLVINCAAWTDVDGCERDAARAYAVNAEGPQNLARASRLAGAGFVTISTDYVFDGEKQGFYTQRDDPNPQSVYAASKLAGEYRAKKAYARTIIVRSGFIFGPGGKNFLSTVIKRICTNETINAISDSVGTPTYALDLAKRVRALAQLDLPAIFHVVNAGEGASYEEFARVASQLKGKSAVIKSVTEELLRRPAKRPMNSRLECLFSDALGLTSLPTWQEALKHFIETSHLSEKAGRD